VVSVMTMFHQLSNGRISNHHGVRVMRVDEFKKT